MGNATKRIKQILLVAGLYAPIRNLHLSKASRDAARARAEMREFFASLLPKDALVFDIGANVGAISEAFADAGARVVALEPNADAARHIQLLYPGKNIQVIQAAVGSHNGLATLHVSSDWDCTCTLSSDWMDNMAQADERYRGNWSRKEAVPLVTLDALVEQFGEPYFIKVDVEGYELEVLRGLSNQPPLLSFEFCKTFLDPAFRCLESALFADGSRFNMADSGDWGYPTKLKFSQWIDKEQMRQALLRLPGSNDQGDIYVRRPQPA
jgi:FkbM family methyltransferase